MMQTNAPLHTVHKSSTILRKHSGSVSPAIPKYGTVNFIHEQRPRNTNNAINIKQITKPCKFYLVILPQIFIYIRFFLIFISELHQTFHTKNKQTATVVRCFFITTDVIRLMLPHSCAQLTKKQY